MKNDYERARAAIKRDLAAKGWNPADLARAASVDVGTVLDFLNGHRQPQLATRGKLATALGWPADSIDDIASGGDAPLPLEPGAQPARLSVVPTNIEPPLQAEEDNEVLAAIRRDPDLDEAARNHFLNQYELLRELSRRKRAASRDDEPALLPYAAHGRRMEPVDQAEEERIQREGLDAVRRNPDSPASDK